MGSHKTSYNPEVPPDAQAWLVSPENQRLRSVATFHMVNRLKSGNQKAHAALHVAIENQIASGFGPTVRAMKRLQEQNLSRHDAIHAIASVLAEHLHKAMNSDPPPDSGSLQFAINLDIDLLTAMNWKTKYGRN
jgi:hypothetical protein